MEILQDTTPYHELMTDQQPKSNIIDLSTAPAQSLPNITMIYSSGI